MVSFSQQVPRANKYEDIVMPEQHRHLANKCEDVVDLHGAEAYCVATHTACITSKRCFMFSDAVC